MKIVISGCSGGGKSTLVGMLQADGYTVFHEPGRQVVKEQTGVGGAGLPWVDPEYFSELCIGRSVENYSESEGCANAVIFDRSYIDALSALEHTASVKFSDYAPMLNTHRYHNKVFFAPPWKAIYQTDDERRHSFSDAVDEYERLQESYTKYGYELVDIPRLDIVARVDWLKLRIQSEWNAIYK